jgi:hypothetical protein
VSTAANKGLKVEVPNANHLAEHFRCELDDGLGDHHIFRWEVVTRFHYDVSDSGDARNFDQDWDVLWWDCDCGHQTSQ